MSLYPRFTLNLPKNSSFVVKSQLLPQVGPVGIRFLRQNLPIYGRIVVKSQLLPQVGTVLIEVLRQNRPIFGRIVVKAPQIVQELQQKWFDYGQNAAKQARNVAIYATTLEIYTKLAPKKPFCRKKPAPASDQPSGN